MTGPEHYAEAEELVRLAEERLEDNVSEAATRLARTYAQLAAVHAQLGTCDLLLRIASNTEPPAFDDRQPDALANWYQQVHS